MIIGPDFIWIHLPKTGGTSAKRFFRELALPGVFVERDDTRLKHESIALREKRTGISLHGRKRFVTLRRLPGWLLSDYHHKVHFMGLSIPFGPVREGKYYSMRLGGQWVAADWWLNYFGVDEDFTVIRLEHIGQDVPEKLLPLLGATAPAAGFPWENKNTYHRGTGQYFSEEDVRRMYAANPHWANLERQHYRTLKHF